MPLSIKACFVSGLKETKFLFALCKVQMHEATVLIIVLVLVVLFLLFSVNGGTGSQGGIGDGTSGFGQLCLEDSDCQQGLVCDLGDHQCRVPPGSPCQPNTEFGPCVGFGECGHSTSDETSTTICCPNGRNKYSNCTGRYFCEQTLNSGDVCRLDEQCLSGHCDGNPGCRLGRCR